MPSKPASANSLLGLAFEIARHFGCSGHDVFSVPSLEDAPSCIFAAGKAATLHGAGGMIATQVFADENVGRVSLRDARAAMLAAASPLPSEEIFLAAARDRTAVRTIRANDDLIPFARSAMDGYAVRSTDTVDAARAPLALPVRGAIYAGDLPGALPPRTATSISTGAPLPFGADAVVPWEEVKMHGDAIVLRRPVIAQAHVFPPGDDARRGDAIVHARELITPGRAAMLAAAGFDRLSVHR